MRGIKINGVHTGDDLSLIQTQFKISEPPVKSSKIELPGGDGDIDNTDFFGEVFYSNRELQAEYNCLKKHSDFISFGDEFSNRYHGKKVNIICDDYPDFYLKGRLSINHYWAKDKGCGIISIIADCEPYKLRLEDTVKTLTVGTAENENLCPPFNLWESADYFEVPEPEIALIKSALAYSCYSPFISVTGLTTITAKFAQCGRFYIFQYDANKSEIAQTVVQESSKTLTLSGSTRYIRIRLLPKSSTVAFSVIYEKPQLYIGTQEKEYTRFENGYLMWCDNLRMRTVPSITVTAATTLKKDTVTVSLLPGTYIIPELELTQGVNLFEVTSSTDGSTVAITYREGKI